MHRQVVSRLELDAIRQFIRDRCPAKTGSKRELYRQLLASEELFERYHSGYRELLIHLVKQCRDDIGAEHSRKAAKDAALESLLDRFDGSQQSLAFLAWIRSEDAGKAAFASGSLRSPAQIVSDYLFRPCVTLVS